MLHASRVIEILRSHTDNKAVADDLFDLLAKQRHMSEDVVEAILSQQPFMIFAAKNTGALLKVVTFGFPETVHEFFGAFLGSKRDLLPVVDFNQIVGESIAGLLEGANELDTIYHEAYPIQINALPVILKSIRSPELGGGHVRMFSQTSGQVSNLIACHIDILNKTHDWNALINIIGHSERLVRVIEKEIGMELSPLAASLVDDIMYKCLRVLGKDHSLIAIRLGLEMLKKDEEKKDAAERK